MVTVNPVTDNQKRAFQEYKNSKNLFLYGAMVLVKHLLHLSPFARTLKNESKYDCVYLVRSAVPTREIGFLPGDEEDKTVCFKYHIRTW